MIEIKELSFSYEEKTVLQNITLFVKAGERLVLLGSSGSGKSTLLRLIAGFLAPTSGEILINNSLVSKSGKILTPPHKRGISMVFQDLALWNHMNVAQNVAFPLKMQKVPQIEQMQQVSKFLEIVSLKGYEERKIDELSGGEQQRVALARALINAPKVLLMDEPLSSLDEELNIRLRQEIVSLQERLGFTLVYVTHNKEEAAAIAHRIVKIENATIQKEQRDATKNNT